MNAPIPNAEAVTHPKGYIVIDGQQVADTLQCVHCGMHWVAVTGSGKVRGYCLRCHGNTCGSPACMECIPFEAKLDFLEGTKNSFAPAIQENAHKFGHII